MVVKFKSKFSGKIREYTRPYDIEQMRKHYLYEEVKEAKVATKQGKVEKDDK